jgi:hypothetical protein
MKASRWRVSMIALILFAAYSVFVVVVSIAAWEGRGVVFWTSIAIIILLAGAALWLSRWIYRRRFTGRTAKPS